MSGFAADILTRVVNVQWGTTEQQPLLVVAGNPTAVAVDTGDTFEGVNSGASGALRYKTFTVLSAGIVVYGKPRDGVACFMACIDGETIRRGVQLEGGSEDTITWTSVFTVPGGDGWGMTALSFAGDAFFVTYQTDEFAISCAASFDGLVFKNVGNPYSGVPTNSGSPQTPGSVASNGQGIYTSVGIFTHRDNYPEIITADNNMMWGSSTHSTDGLNWSSGYSYPEITNPGIRPASIHLSSDAVAYTTVAGGIGLFVAAGTTKSAFKRYAADIIGDTSQDIHPTASAAVSSDGMSWSAVPLPGAFAANYVPVVGGGAGTVTDESVSASVAFIRTKGKDDRGRDKGYFVISASGAKVVSGSSEITGSWCWKGDGSIWSMIKHKDSFGFGTVSAIAKKLSSTTIVRI